MISSVLWKKEKQNMSKIELNELELKALDRLLEYVYNDEEKSFSEAIDSCESTKGHIFRDIDVLAGFMDNNVDLEALRGNLDKKPEPKAKQVLIDHKQTTVRYSNYRVELPWNGNWQFVEFVDDEAKFADGYTGAEITVPLEVLQTFEDTDVGEVRFINDTTL